MTCQEAPLVLIGLVPVPDPGLKDPFCPGCLLPGEKPGLEEVSTGSKVRLCTSGRHWTPTPNTDSSVNYLAIKHTHRQRLLYTQ